MSNVDRVAIAAFLDGALLAVPALVQQPVRGKEAGDLALGFGAIGVLPERGGRVGAIGGWPDAGNSLSSQFDVGWFAMPNLSLNAIAATTRHKVHVRGSVLGNVDLGHVQAQAPLGVERIG